MADFLTPAELKDFQDLSESAMPDEADIYERVTTEAGRDREITYPERRLKVPCRATANSQSAGASAPVFGNQVSDPVTQVAFPLGTVVEEGDKLVVRVAQTGLTHILKVDAIPVHSYSVDIRCICTRFSP